MVAAQMQIHKELEEASVVSGAPWRTTFRRIIIPLLTPAVINGGLWVALHAMRELSIAMMLFTPGSVVLSTIIWSYWQGGEVCAASAIGVMLIIALITMTFLGRVVLLRLVKTY